MPSINAIMVLKFGTGPQKEKKLEEYVIYKQLSEAGVIHGLVGVHGLFDEGRYRVRGGWGADSSDEDGDT